MLVDKENGYPLYFIYVAGNIVDVSTIASTKAELKAVWH
jgi:transposase